MEEKIIAKANEIIRDAKFSKLVKTKKQVI